MAYKCSRRVPKSTTSRLSILVLYFLLEFVEVVHDHEAEGKRVKDVKELVRAEIVIGWQLKGSYELILKEFTMVKCLIKAERRTQGEQEKPQIGKFDEGGCIWVIFSPNLSESLSLLVVKQSCIFYLSLFKAIDNQCDEQFEKD